MSNFEEDIEDVEDNKTYLGIPLFWDPAIHGLYTENLRDKIILMESLNLNDFYTNDNSKLFLLNDLVKHFSTLWDIKFKIHPNILNYLNIIRGVYKNIYPKLEIVQVKMYYIGETEFYTVLIKTFWLKIIQRAWKKICAQRFSIINQRKLIKNINYRNINGIWPRNLNYLPTLTDIKLINRCR